MTKTKSKEYLENLEEIVFCLKAHEIIHTNENDLHREFKKGQNLINKLIEYWKEHNAEELKGRGISMFESIEASLGIPCHILEHCNKYPEDTPDCINSLCLYYLKAQKQKKNISDFFNEVLK